MGCKNILTTGIFFFFQIFLKDVRSNLLSYSKFHLEDICRMDRRAYGHIQLISNSEVDGFLRKVDFGQENFKFCEGNMIFAPFCLSILLPFFLCFTL